MAGADNSKPKTSGFIVLDKPEGLSSMTAIAILRRKAGGVKTGHAGTLDPLATGVLVAAVGRATKSISRVMDTT
ncbi:MAG: tRNA pseudouridine(55) synthase TruB, partial [Planctomycetota bacterium]|nr:tRNA pseudouridine(55) synthase TruB [Planctomycetota bacterium]